ncbi:MAG: phosphate transport system permease protein PstA [Dehalococcoidia bacterium]|nr:MAG: phosphate transport system permease protein PstA [Dehalococcoidia bacterium]
MEGQLDTAVPLSGPSVLLRDDAYTALRKLISRLMAAVVALSAALVVAIMLIILGYVIVKGLPAINWDFFFDRERSLILGTERGGGIGPAIQGTLIMLALASLLGVPLGIFTAVYLSEFGRGRFATLIRFLVDLLAGFPSIVIGVFVWTVVVRPRLITDGFSGLAGSIALAIIMVPVVAKTVEEVLRLVPRDLREAALALGVPTWRTILFVVLPVARNGIITGAILAAARAGGETAPLLLTAGNNRFFNVNILEPMASMPVYIYTYTFSPFAVLNERAWGTAMVLIVVIGLLSLLTRLVTGGKLTR